MDELTMTDNENRQYRKALVAQGFSRRLHTSERGMIWSRYDHADGRRVMFTRVYSLTDGKGYGSWAVEELKA